MMKQPSFPLKALILGLVLSVTLSACRTLGQVPYFQDADSLLPGPAPPVQALTLCEGDQISIVVHSREPELSKMFNLVAHAATGGSSRESFYTLNPEGQIHFPVLGALKIAGMSRAEVAAYLRQRLIAEDLLKDPVVIVEFRNLAYYVMGEVASPGRYPLDRDHLTLLEALAAAGDLTLEGRRTNVLLLRTRSGTQEVYRLNLNKLDNIYKSPAYYIRQNDLLYVQPTPKRALGASQNASYFANLMNWTSVLSFMASLFLLLRNLSPAKD